MKQWLPTLLLVVAAIGGIWYLTANDYFSKTEQNAEGKQLISLINKDIEAIEISSDDNQLKLTAEDGNWQIEGKKDMPVVSSNVDGWITEMMQMLYSEVIDEEAPDLAIYGLQKPSETYKVKRKNEAEIVIHVGDELPTQGARYVRLGKQKKVYEVSADYFDKLNKGILDFIDKNPITVNYDAVERVQVSWRSNKYDLQLVSNGESSADKKWKLDDKTDLSHNDVKNVLTDLSIWATLEEPRPFSEFNPTDTIFELTFTELQNGKSIQREIVGFAGIENIWIAEKGKPWVYFVSTESINDFVVKVKNLHEVDNE